MDTTSSDSDSTSVVIKDLVKIVCYPTIFSKRYIKLLSHEIGIKFPGIKLFILCHGSCTSIELYTIKPKTIVNILKNVIIDYQLRGLRCGMCVISTRKDREHWIVPIDGPCSDDNDFLYNLENVKSDTLFI